MPSSSRTNGDGGYTDQQCLARCCSGTTSAARSAAPSSRTSCSSSPMSQTQLTTRPEPRETNSVIPTPFLNGDLSTLCTSQGASFVNGVCSNAACSSTARSISPAQSPARSPLSARQPFLNNQVPISSKVAGIDGLVSARSRSRTSSRPTTPAATSTATRAISKIDWQATHKDHVMGRYSQMYTINRAPTAPMC